MHERVTPLGKELGRNAVRLADLGLKRLKQAGLDEVAGPMLREDMCKTCACRPGTVPNGCLQTQLDFLKAVVEGVPFACHSPRNGKLCAGWVRARAQVAASPVPPELAQMVAKWEFSPPDSDKAPDM